MNSKSGLLQRGNLLAVLGCHLLAFICFLVPETVDAHGYMTYPQCRSSEHLKGDAPAWPIAGIKASLRREPCVGLPYNNQLTRIETGPLRLKLLFPDGANHVGPCYAFLFDPFDPGNRVKIGETMDCARSSHPDAGKKGEDISGYMDVIIPDDLPCNPGHCVLQWVWIGMHKGAEWPEQYEHYDSCADIAVTDAAGYQPVASASPIPSSSFADKDKRSPDRDFTGITGNYSVEPVQGDWDTGEISLLWTDLNGTSWGLRTDPSNPDILLTDQRNPYFQQGIYNFRLLRDGAGKIAGFDFGGRKFQRDPADPTRFSMTTPKGKEDQGELQLVWTNRAGISWLLIPEGGNQDKLITGSGNPYAGQGLSSFDLIRNNAGEVTGYLFGGSTYQRQ